MERLTIDYGIDLGTTNSSIAVFGKNGPEVIRCQGADYMPSAVYVERGGEVRVGKYAKQRLVADDKNSAADFKLLMGTPQTKRFEKSGIVMTPEELSAEVLKELKKAVIAGKEETLDAAVITVPADFVAAETQATDRAAQLAGLKVRPLLQEPVAAALAYGFDHQAEKVFWLVFDLGGGTFDAALVNVRDGLIRVVNHGGVKPLGGKDIDWLIVDTLLVPELHKSFALPDFHRGNDRWSSAFATLKDAAEEARIHVSSFPSGNFLRDYVCTDDNGRRVELEFTLRQDHVAKLIEPLVMQAITICKKVIAEQRLKPGDIEKVLLVGGPTQTPHLRAMLADPNIGLGIPLECKIDPLTVVAQGASVFAASQKRQPTRSSTHSDVAVYQLDLDYQPMSIEREPLIGGKVRPPSGSVAGFTIQFTNREPRSAWQSGRVPLSPGGTFTTTLWAEEQRRSTFHIELYDPQGNACRVEPDRIEYTVCLPPGASILSHDIGIATADNRVDVVFKKGSPLPLSSAPPLESPRHRHRTVTPLRKGVSNQALKIPIVEGNYAEADLNPDIGYLTILANDVARDVPVGQEVEIMLEINESRILSGRVFIPILDEEFRFSDVDLKKPIPKQPELKEDAGRQACRIAELQQNADLMPDRGLLGKLAEIKGQAVAISRLIEESRDADAALTCQNQLLALKAQLREIERSVEIPKLREDARNEVAWTEQAVQSHANAEERHLWESLKVELEKAIEGHSDDLLRQKVEEVSDLRMRLKQRDPSWWLGLHEYLSARRAEMTDADLAARWSAHNQHAIANGDLEALRSGCRQLWGLLPVEKQQRGYGGSTVKDNWFAAGTSSR